MAVRAAEWLKRPALQRSTVQPPDDAVDWLLAGHFQIVNVAGPRQSEAPGIYAAAYEWLQEFIARYRAANASTSQNRSTSAGVL